jgi:hypothetical protein
MPLRDRLRAVRRESWALVLLTVGTYAGPFGLVPGWVLAARSDRWNRWQKLRAAVVLPVLVLASTRPVVLVIDGLTCPDGEDARRECMISAPPIILWPLTTVLLLLLGSTVAGLVRAARHPR